jgi:flagellar protein FlbT
MTKSMQLSLRAGERIYINGAVVRVDRKVTIELLNDVAFLLEAHVLQSEQTTTPLRQLYFVLQAILVDPVNAAEALALFRRVHASMLQSFDNEAVVNGLRAAAALVDRNRIFEALRMIRTLFDIEEEILARGDEESSKAA